VFGQKYGWERVNYFASAEENTSTSKLEQAFDAMDEDMRKHFERSVGGDGDGDGDGNGDGDGDGDGNGSSLQAYFNAAKDVDRREAAPRPEQEHIANPTIDTQPPWLPYARAEHLHTRNHVSLLDMSSFAKIMVQGKDAEKLLQRLCCADVTGGAAASAGADHVDLEAGVGVVTYTGMLNEQGGYETDCTVTKLGPESFVVVSPTSQATRDADWIRRNIDSRYGSNRQRSIL
jgi:glycine cleavage system aminomethyltransferase T